MPSLNLLLRALGLSSALLGLYAHAQPDQEPAAAPAKIEPFHTDGCSWFPDRTPAGQTDWCSCCVAHDLRYWRGGTAAEREAADQALRLCVKRATGSVGLADTMFSGVRVGGSPYLFTSFRWGYGWPFGRHYTPLSAEETAQADAEQALYLAGNPQLNCPAAQPTPLWPYSSGMDRRPSTH